jgi:hypothetical protein
MAFFIICALPVRFAHGFIASALLNLLVGGIFLIALTGDGVCSFLIIAVIFSIVAM